MGKGGHIFLLKERLNKIMFGSNKILRNQQFKSTWAAVAGAGAGWALNTLGNTQGKTNQAVAAADPFASQRPQYQSELSGLMAGTIDPTKAPGVQQATDYGMGALDRQIAARGGLNSGSEKAGLEQYAQSSALGQFNTDVGRSEEHTSELQSLRHLVC